MQITLTATPASLCSGCVTSPLTFVRGWHLTSTSAEFGGLSSLHATRVRRLLAISDSGYWFEFGDGSDGIAPEFASIFELRDEAGISLVGTGDRGGDDYMADAEGLAVHPTGAPLWVSFERQHRIWEYDVVGGNATALGVDVDNALAAACTHDTNSGVESLVAWNATHLLAMCEAGEDEAATTLAAMLLHTETGAITNFRYPYAGFSAPLPVDLARVDGIGVLVLERTYEAGVGNTIRLLLLPEAQLDDGTETLAPHLIHEFTPDVEALDNFEGLAARVEGETIRLFMVSDDNFNVNQKTLLYEFELPVAAIALAPPSAPPSAPPPPPSPPSPPSAPSPPSTPPSVPPSPSPPPVALETGAIVGISVGSVVAALLCLALLMRVARDHKIAKSKKDPRKKKKQTKVVEVTALGKTDEKV